MAGAPPGGDANLPGRQGGPLDKADPGRGLRGVHGRTVSTPAVGEPTGHTRSPVAPVGPEGRAPRAAQGPAHAEGVAGYAIRHAADAAGPPPTAPRGARSDSVPEYAAEGANESAPEGRGAGPSAGGREGHTARHSEPDCGGGRNGATRSGQIASGPSGTTTPELHNLPPLMLQARDAQPQTRPGLTLLSASGTWRRMRLA